jgi:glycosyltransferase involved in cell wall biosynthesis
MSEKLLSIIVPVKNDTRIFNLVAQIARQENNYVETIIVANGADDEFEERLQIKLKSLRFKILLTSSQADIANSRNIGINAAQGKYLLFIDSDCSLTSNYLKNITQYLSSLKREIIGRGVIKFIPKNTLFSKLNSEVRDRKYARLKQICFAPNLVISSSIMKKVCNFHSGIGYGVDTEWGRRAELAGYKITQMPDNIKINHSDDVGASKTLKTWFFYGVGESYREKKHYLAGHCSRSQLLRSLFSRSNLVDKTDGLPMGVFVFVYEAIKALGVLYGLLVKWRGLNKVNLLG